MASTGARPALLEGGSWGGGDGGERSSEHVPAGDARDETLNDAGFAPHGWLPDKGPAVLASDSQTATPMNAGANEVETWESER